MIWVYIIFFLLIAIISLWIYKALHIPIPYVEQANGQKSEARKSKEIVQLDNTFCKKNEYDIYEVYVEGDSFERGYAMGQVIKELKVEHEQNFVESLYTLVPSKTYIRFLRIVIGLMNRNLHLYVKQEYKEELLGLSFSSNPAYNFIAPPYQRVLNYHAAHDIGHALQNLGLVACSSFVVKNQYTSDGDLILARNLDFSPSEKFNKLKTLYFVNPKKGYKYISYSWPGFIGVVSGMNEKGLCVVLHAAKSKMQFKIGTPVSLIAREIIQEAANLDEAKAILEKRRSFVSELFLIVSATEKTACVFEKEPNSLSSYYMEQDKLICTNHYLSKTKKDTLENIEWKNQISSAYRETRLKELLNDVSTVTPSKAATILRDIKGVNNTDIGLQNESAINQLAAHHGIIFQPEKLNFWVSANPYSMGAMVAYNLKDGFSLAQKNPANKLYKDECTIAADEFLYSKEYNDFLQYKILEEQIHNAIKNDYEVDNSVLEQFILLNPKLFLAYETVANYYFNRRNKQKAKGHYESALKCKIPTTFEKNRIEKKLHKC